MKLIKLLRWVPILILVSACKAGEQDTTEVLESPIFTSGQNAELVIGQPDFTSSYQGTTASTFSSLWGGAAVVNGKVYVPDYGNNRVLGFNSLPTTNGASADFVIGQTDFVSSSSGNTACKFNGASTPSAANGKLAIDDVSNHRVLLYNGIPTTTNPSAVVAVGQADLTSRASSCNRHTIFDPGHFIMTSQKLVVADSGHNRILIYNSIPTSSGAPADLVLGQTDFDSCSGNRGTGVPDADTLDYPTGVWTDGTRLIVSDGGNNRILIWTTFPTYNGQPADLVIGQADFTLRDSDRGGVVSGSGFYYPSFIASDGKVLAVPDCGNNRVLIWNSIPTASDQPADVVLGQPDFTSNAGATTQAGIASCPSGAAFSGKHLLISDYGANRVLVYKGQ